MRATMTPAKYLTLRETAQRLRVRPETLRRWIRNGVLPAVRIPGRYLVAESDLAMALEPARRREGR